eukprot:5727606-Pyramimonas_sp.AAC.1
MHAQYMKDLSFTNGVGGTALPVAKALAPLTFCECGVLEFLVLPRPCPPLLPAGFLDFLRAEIDAAGNALLMGAET